MTLNPEIDARVRASFAQQSMMHTLGAEIVALDAGRCSIRSSIPPGARQQQGFGHAGLTFSIGDSAAGYAALTCMELDCEVVTSEIKINLLAPAMGDYLLAEGRVIRPGRRLITVQSEVWAITGDRRKQVAVLLGTMVPVPLAPPS
jgi:uncharacterized protein (TIGR00369 family)